MNGLDNIKEINAWASSPECKKLVAAGNPGAVDVPARSKARRQAG